MGSKADAEQKCLLVVADYLQQQNRPYSIMDIFNNLHKEFGKTLLIKTLEALVEKGDIKERTISKQRIFWYDQTKIPTVDDTVLAEMDSSITSKSAELQTLNDRIKSLEAQRKAMSVTLTKAQLLEKLESIRDETQTVEVKLDKLKDPNRVTVSAEETAKINSDKENYTKQWTKRKRIATDILDSILEHYPKKKRDLFEEIGIENDDES